MRPHLGPPVAPTWLVVRGPAPGGLGAAELSDGGRPAGPGDAADATAGWRPPSSAAGCPTRGRTARVRGSRRRARSHGACREHPGRAVSDPTSSTRSGRGSVRTPRPTAPSVSPSRRRRATPARCSAPARCARVTRTVRDELFGAGRLQALLDDPDVTDVLVNGPRDVWVERAGRLGRSDVDLGGADDVRALAVRLAAAGGQRLDDASPAVDARLPDGTRLHAVLPPVAGAVRADQPAGGPVPRVHASTQLVASGTLAPPLVPGGPRARRDPGEPPGLRGDGLRQDDAARRAAVAGPARRAARGRRGGRRAGPGAPARRPAARAARERRRRRAGGPDRPGPARAAHAARPDRARGVPGRRGPRGARRAEHRARRRVRHRARQRRRRRARAARGARRAGRDVPRGRRRAGRERVRRGAAPAARRTARYVAEVGVVRRGAAGELEVACALRVDPSGVTVPGPAWPALADRLGLPVARARSSDASR